MMIIMIIVVVAALFVSLVLLLSLTQIILSSIHVLVINSNHRTSPGRQSWSLPRRLGEGQMGSPLMGSLQIACL